MPQVSIVYCKPCGYLKKAQAVASALERELGITAVLEAGRAGAFEARIEGVPVIQRRRDYLPGPADVVRAVRAALLNTSS